MHASDGGDDNDEVERGLVERGCNILYWFGMLARGRIIV